MEELYCHESLGEYHIVVETLKEPVGHLSYQGMAFLSAKCVFKTPLMQSGDKARRQVIDWIEKEVNHYGEQSLFTI